jgi:hypothetical protein
MIPSFLKFLSMIFLLSVQIIAQDADKITPYKYTDPTNLPVYNIPASARFTVARSEEHAPEIVYYLSMPDAVNYPLVIMCGGSSSRNDIRTIMHFHRYFLEEFLNLQVGVITVEQWGVDGDSIDAEAFIQHYTITKIG